MTVWTVFSDRVSFWFYQKTQPKRPCLQMDKSGYIPWSKAVESHQIRPSTG
eukprot:NODE_4058_length_846_cov_13.735257_g3360_i0.p4 GENE.NODE_4058_length_846_cov_13.735257_g3360_i0~~NODE_4058_length_846_cov_13.735257_g3360_i0.p4  ORF type:complete len:51 (-),score=1.03 NODE_4058_length_846_cov_13.735257_g3360_i0:182-334(-)